MVKKCLFCGHKTTITPLLALRASALSRPSHSPVRSKFKPMCALNEAGRKNVLRLQVAELTNPMSDAELEALENALGVLSPEQIDQRTGSKVLAFA